MGRRAGVKAKTTSQLRKTAWRLLSELIRRREAGHDGGVICYTCGKWMHWKQAQAAHAIPGRHAAVLLNEDVIRVCCYRCNIALHGNYTVFTTKLIKVKGMEWWDQQLVDSHRTVKLTRVDLLEKIEEFRRRLNAIG